MKKFVSSLAVIMVVALIALVGLVGCTNTANTGSNSTSTANGEPSMQPADHEGRFESLGENGCYGCHGNSEKGNPTLADAVAAPENHYVDSSYDSMEFDPARNQCITCHPVGGE